MPICVRRLASPSPLAVTLQTPASCRRSSSWRTGPRRTDSGRIQEKAGWVDGRSTAHGATKTETGGGVRSVGVIFFLPVTEIDATRGGGGISLVYAQSLIVRAPFLSHHLVLQHAEAVLAQPGQVLELVLRPRAHPKNVVTRAGSCTGG